MMTFAVTSVNIIGRSDQAPGDQVCDCRFWREPRSEVARARHPGPGRVLLVGLAAGRVPPVLRVPGADPDHVLQHPGHRVRHTERVRQQCNAQQNQF